MASSSSIFLHFKGDGVMIPFKSRVSHSKSRYVSVVPGIKIHKSNKRVILKPYDVLVKGVSYQRKVQKKTTPSNLNPKSSENETKWEELIQNVIQSLHYAREQEAVSNSFSPLNSFSSKKLSSADIMYIVHNLRHRKRTVSMVWEYWHAHIHYSPNAHLFTKVISILGQGKMYKTCLTLSDTMLQEGCKIDACLYNVLISTYGRIGKPELALELFTKMSHEGVNPTIVTYGSVINVLVKSARMNEALSIFEIMKNDSQNHPTVRIFNTVLYGLAKQSPPLDLNSILNEMNKYGLKPNSITFTILLKSYQQAELYDRVTATWQQLRLYDCTPDSQLFTVVLLVLSRAQKFPEMEKVFRMMMKMDGKVDCFSYSVLLQALARSGDSNKFRKYFQVMVSNKTKLNSGVFNTLLHEFSQNGNFEFMEWMMHEMLTYGCRFNKQTFEIIVEGYATCGRIQCMSDTFACMQRFGFRPCVRTWSFVLSAYAKAGLVTETQTVLMHMKNAKLMPNEDAYAVLTRVMQIDRSELMR